MKKFNFKPLMLAALVAVLFSGCAGLQKMKKNADQIQFKVTPEVLEANAGKVDVAIDGRFPAKYFNKKATLVATPVLKYNGGETEYEPVTVQGEKVEANNKVISYSTGGSFSYKDAKQKERPCGFALHRADRDASIVSVDISVSPQNNLTSFYRLGLKPMLRLTSAAGFPTPGARSP